jgi:hypothetical protein
MNIRITKKFNTAFAKLSVLQMEDIFKFFIKIEKLPINTVLSNKDIVRLLNTEENIFVLRASNELRVFGTVIEDKSEKVLLLLDVLTYHSAIDENIKK